MTVVVLIIYIECVCVCKWAGWPGTDRIKKHRRLRTTNGDYVGCWFKVCSCRWSSRSQSRRQSKNSETNLSQVKPLPVSHIFGFDKHEVWKNQHLNKWNAFSFYRQINKKQLVKAANEKKQIDNKVTFAVESFWIKLDFVSVYFLHLFNNFTRVKTFKIIFKMQKFSFICNSEQSTGNVQNKSSFPNPKLNAASFAWNCFGSYKSLAKQIFRMVHCLVSMVRRCQNHEEQRGSSMHCIGKRRFS